LKELKLSDTQIKISPHLFDKLANLETLWLSNNFIDKIPDHAFDGVHSLKVLDLSYNKLSSLGETLFSHLSRLKELYLESNDLKTLPSQLLTPLRCLDVLNLEQNLSLMNVPMFHPSCPLKSLHMDDHLSPSLYGHSSGYMSSQTRILLQKEYQIREILIVNDISSLSECLVVDLRLKYLCEAFSQSLSKLNKGVLDRTAFAFVSGSNPFVEALPFRDDLINYVLFVDHDCPFIFQNLGKPVHNVMILRLQPSNLHDGILQAFKRIEDGQWDLFSHQFVPLKSTRLLVLGNGGVGKTALLNKLEQKKLTSSTDKPDTISTIGFDIGVLDINGYQIFFSDFAGQIEYTSIHQHFISDAPNSQDTLVLVDAFMDAQQLTNTKNWLMMLKEKNQTAVSIVVSKIDMVTMTPEIRNHREQVLIQTCSDYGISPKIFFVSSVTDEGLSELRDHIGALARNRSYQTFIPKRCSDLPNTFSLQLESLSKKGKIIVSADSSWSSMYGFLEYQSRLGSILFDRSQLTICTDPTRLSKAMALFFAPKSQFFGAPCGKAEFDGGIISFSKIHSLFCQYQKHLVPNGTEQETQRILAFFSRLGICRLLNVDESNQYLFNGESAYEFPDLAEYSYVPFLPPTTATTKPELQPRKALRPPAALPTGRRAAPLPPLSGSTTELTASGEGSEQLKVLCLAFSGVSTYHFSKLRCFLIQQKDPNYKSFLNSVILTKNQNMELWYHCGDRLSVIVRGVRPGAVRTKDQIIGMVKEKTGIEEVRSHIRLFDFCL